MCGTNFIVQGKFYEVGPGGVMRDPTPKELEEYKKSLELDASKCHDIGCDYCIAYGYPYFGKKFPLQSHAA